ncbi:ribulose-phosphate 3-epimerase [candidate division KSB1 bacterium]|nr:ribulose-phosphate 3-epimerase [candidate division KSB1 bacterium]NIR70398.1 ribulose-phosphate 3-epimerase [candidate division KSB1 bacterium]NIS25938.1 ribulose-phosphate 3-epimerase [candidate division KSB1 bacterium]NIT69961.1 ribulose-phosphate 3-epimerase [candidate division KSB1 bacterium]NIU26626.1 ribulose-phosphate 3-epimerase [candidate division KSB1 bacterium]
MVKIAPSILSADFSKLRDQIEIAEQAGADWLHLDVMDGHFVPNITFGPIMVEAVKKMTNLPLDVHLMIENPDDYIRGFRDAGADTITVHVEASRHLNRTLNEITKLGAQVGVALNPATPTAFLEQILNDVNLILVMTVNPGFGGQKFISFMVKKIRFVANLIKESGRDIYLEVDGGIDKLTTPTVVEAGANVLVSGSAIFGAADIAKALTEIKSSIPDPEIS